MDVLTHFTKYLSECDQIRVTHVSEDRLYCRFYKDGLYLGRMFITEASLCEELQMLSSDEESINQAAFDELKSKYCAPTS
jgi:hypothetical protein